MFFIRLNDVYYEFNSSGCLMFSAIVGTIAIANFCFAMKIYFLSIIRFEPNESLVIWMIALGSMMIALFLTLWRIQPTKRFTHDFLILFGLLVQYLAMILEVLSLFQSLALVTGGIEETRKLWIKSLRWSTYIMTIISTAYSLFFGSIWAIKIYASPTNIAHKFYEENMRIIHLINNLNPVLFTSWMAFVCTVVFIQLRQVYTNSQQQQQRMKQRTKQMKRLTFLWALGFTFQVVYFTFNIDYGIYYFNRKCENAATVNDDSKKDNYQNCKGVIDAELATCFISNIECLKSIWDFAESTGAMVDKLVDLSNPDCNDIPSVCELLNKGCDTCSIEIEKIINCVWGSTCSNKYNNYNSDNSDGVMISCTNVPSPNNLELNDNINGVKEGNKDSSYKDFMNILGSKMKRVAYAQVFCFWLPQLVMLFILLLDYDEVVKLRKKTNKKSGPQASKVENISINRKNAEIEMVSLLKDFTKGRKQRRKSNNLDLSNTLSFKSKSNNMNTIGKTERNLNENLIYISQRNISGIRSQENPIYNSKRKIIGYAPIAPRPISLFSISDINTIRDHTPKHGQKFLEPVNWSLSIRNFILLAEYILSTDTWSVLSQTKGGENNITMYDINQHFTIPWSIGTGCSIALLLDLNPGKVELMLSHSWAGSFRQTLAAIKTLITMHFLSLETLIFFCAFSQYQAEDNVSNGLTIQQQLWMEPFQRVIESKPKCGMSVIHTTLSEVYERLWCVDEVYEAQKASIEVFGLFDPSVWLLSKFAKTISIETRKAKCTKDKDEKMLRSKIARGGGFAPLDVTIQKFRKKAKRDLALVLKFRASFGDLELELDDNPMFQNESPAQISKDDSKTVSEEFDWDEISL